MIHSELCSACGGPLQLGVGLVFLSFHILFFPFSPSTHPIFGRFWGKWGWASSFHIHFFNPQNQISTHFGENSLGPHPVEYPFVTACVFGP